MRNVIEYSLEGKKGREAQKGDGTMGENVTIGIDLGDKAHRYCMLNDAGEVVMEGEVGSTRNALKKMFSRMAPARIAIEAGTHSAWVSSELEWRLGDMRFWSGIRGSCR